MKYLLLSVLVVSLIGVMSVPDAFAKMYTDPDNRFSIEYPSGWLPDSSVDEVEFVDKYDWNGMMWVWFYGGSDPHYDLSYVGTSDNNILQVMEEDERSVCNLNSYAEDGFVCYNFKVNNSLVVYTDENRKAYFIDFQYTKQYSDPAYPGEFPMRATGLETHVGNNVWYIGSEMDSGYTGQYLDEVIRSSYSFNLSSGSTSTSFKKYTDDYNRFTIDYPDNWVLSDSHPDEIIAIQDKYSWRTNFQVFWNDDDTLDNRSDSKVLRAIERNESEMCGDETGGIRKCSDFKVVDSYVMYTDDNKKVYFIKQTYTIVWNNVSGKITGKEYPVVSIVGLIYDGNGSWFIQTESHEEVFANHYDEIIHMMKSFSLNSQSTQTFTPPPAPTPPPTPTPTPTPSAESSVSIPAWIKSNAGWWVDGTIDDSSFLQGIEYLINQGIIVIPPTTASGTSDSQEVPAWVKSNAGWWVDGTIDDGTFVSGIQYLVQVRIIQVG